MGSSLSGEVPICNGRFDCPTPGSIGFRPKLISKKRQPVSQTGRGSTGPRMVDLVERGENRIGEFAASPSDAREEYDDLFVSNSGHGL